MRGDQALELGGGHRLDESPSSQTDEEAPSSTVFGATDNPTPTQIENSMINHSKTAHIALELARVLAPLEDVMKREVRWNHAAALTHTAIPAPNLAQGATQPKRARFADDVAVLEPDAAADDAAIDEAVQLAAQDPKMPPSHRWKWLTKVLRSQTPSFKAIVYSSSRQVLQDVQVKLEDYYGLPAVATYFSNQKDSADITKFRNQASYVWLQRVGLTSSLMWVAGASSCC